MTTEFFQECLVGGSEAEVCQFANFRREMLAAGHDADAIEIMPLPLWAEQGLAKPVTATLGTGTASGAHMGSVALLGVALAAGVYTVYQQIKVRRDEIAAIADSLQPRVTEPSPWEAGAVAERAVRPSIEVPFEARSTSIRGPFDADSTPIRDVDRASIDAHSTATTDWFDASGEPNYTTDPAVEILHRRWEAMLQEGATFDPTLGRIHEPVEVNDDYQLLKYLMLEYRIEPRTFDALKRVWGIDTVTGRSRGSKAYEMALARRNLYAQTLESRILTNV